MSESMSHEALTKLYSEGHEQADIAREAHRRGDDSNAERFRTLANKTFSLAQRHDTMLPNFEEHIYLYDFEEFGEQLDIDRLKDTLSKSED